jgi:hypothetical protein
MSFLNFFSKKSKLPDIPEKAPTKKDGLVLANFLGKSKGSVIANSITNTTDLSLSSHFRSASSIAEVVKKLVLASPDLSHAVETKIRTTISPNYKSICYDKTGQVDVKATKLLHTFLLRLDLSTYDYTKYTKSTDLRSLSASLLLDSFRYGAMALELVLGATRLPSYLSPIPTRLIQWVDSETRQYPVYKRTGGDIPLDYPTVFYSASIQDGETAYADSPLQAAIQACLWDADFIDALRRAAIKNLFQRLRVKINTDAYIKTLDIETQNDKTRLKAAMDATSSALEAQLAGLTPEDALVLFDIIEADTIQDGNRSEDRSMDVLQSIINGKMAAGAKILPSIIGRGVSSNAASTESALFLKSIASAQDELNLLLSRAFTFAMRLYGFEVTVWFKFDEVNLRPELELESFKAIKQSTILQQLSLGMLKDEDAVIALTGSLPPDGYKPLSGTGFMTAKPADTSGNDYSNTSVSADGKPDSTQSQKDGEVKPTGVKSS